MRAHEFYPQIDEDWKKWGVPAAYAAINAAALGARVTGTVPQEPPAQTQEISGEDDDSLSVTYELPPARGQVGHPQKHTKHISKDQATLLALTMWGEARNQGAQGMRAVGHVIVNRMHSERDFGASVKDVVWKRKAFSCWNPSDPNREAMREISQLSKDSMDYKRWKQAKKLAAELLAGRLRDITGGALFYHTDNVSPGWAEGMRPVAQLANHLFYREDHKREG